MCFISYKFNLKIIKYMIGDLRIYAHITLHVYKIQVNHNPLPKKPKKKKKKKIMTLLLIFNNKIFY